MPRWLLYALLTMLLWGAWGAVSKPASTGLSPWQVQALSTLGIVPVVAVLGASRGVCQGCLASRGFWLAIVSGVITSAGNVACFQAMGAGGKAAAVIPLTSLYPLVTIVLAVMFLHERLNGIQVAGVVASLAALYCFNVASADDQGWLSPWLAVALIPIFLWGISALLQKLATGYATSEQVTFGFLLGFAPVAILTPLFESLPVGLPERHWMLLIVLGLLFGLGNLTLIRAYGAGGRAAIVTPLASLYSLVTLPLAVVFLDERIGAREGLGIGFALLATGAFAWVPGPRIDPPS